MSVLESAYRRGQRDALQRYKLAAPSPTNPTVKDSPLLRRTDNDPTMEERARLQAPTHPDTVKSVFNAAEQSKTRIEPNKKLAEDLCTTCRKPKHYGPCLKPSRTRPDGTPLKNAGFNAGLSGDDPEYAYTSEDGPSTSPHYHSATTADSSLARARDTLPPDQQAATGFADLYRHLGIEAPADQAVNLTQGLNKTALEPSTAIHSMSENRGPTTNIYEQIRVPGKAPIVGFGDEADQRVDRAFDQVDGAVDTTNIEGTWGGPEAGPAVLG